MMMAMMEEIQTLLWGLARGGGDAIDDPADRHTYFSPLCMHELMTCTQPQAYVRTLD